MLTGFLFFKKNAILIVTKHARKVQGAWKSIVNHQMNKEPWYK